MRARQQPAITGRIHLLAALLAGTIAVAALPSAASADHDLFRHISAGQINGNGAFDVNNTVRASEDGRRVFFETVERLVSADTDSSRDVYERSFGSTKLVSAGQVNGNGAFDAFLAGTSDDGSRVFFQTDEQLVSGDTDGSVDIYERSGGGTKQVSAGQINGNGAFSAFFRGASADGSRVFFGTTEKLVSGDTDAREDVYQRAGGKTKRISAGQVNGNGDFQASFVGASTDGSRVFFAATEQLVPGDTDASTDVYERSAGTTKLVSAGQINGNGAFNSSFARASADGSRVFFQTNEKLVSADTDTRFDVYERSAGTTTRISPGNGAFDAIFRGASADGSRVFFSTSEKLVSADTDTASDIYQRSGGSTNRISAGQINGNGAFDPSLRGFSDDGARVFFETAEKLVSADTDAAQDVYERSAGKTKLVSAGQINGSGAFTAFFQRASADGSRVFFGSSEPLVPADTDTAIDVYERAAGETSLISPGDGAFNAGLRATSADGSAVFFETAEKVVASDKDTAIDLYGAYTAP